MVEEIVWLGDIPIISLRPKIGGGINIYNIHTDHLNAPRLITGSVNPGIRWRWDAEPFGSGTVNNNPSGAGTFDFHLRFPGQIYVAETGLNYNYFRDYDPATGRYIESDPIGLAGGLNTYAYVRSNPLTFYDPDGRMFLDPQFVRRMGQRACALWVLQGIYRQERQVNWEVRDKDKYFHCKFNCESAKCGPGGSDAACEISDFKEWTNSVQGDDPEDSRKDQEANRHGRDGAVAQPSASCRIICERYRSPNMPAQF
ncbi:RHS repeat-associated core domain-containing protein [Steroidobacter cummioxidans]|uniref:RHS repeat-associated core domain-containing protein n=1 Tax=Steroidobacter cummioxidans TaxID=1803913 RepID=UPI0019D45790|nr:RHS repeat-associated core domain-containing protein [Steroidobacter cummioxidans]